MSYLNRRITETQFHFVVVFEGRLDEARLNRALRLAMDAEPVFGCRYVPSRRPHWRRREDLDSLSLCEVIQSDDVRRELTEFQSRTCDAASDPLLQASIVRGATDTLCLKISHCAADNAGGEDLLNLVASIYRGLGDDPEYRVTPNLGSRSFMQLFRHIGMRKSLEICWRSLRQPLPRLQRDRNGWRFPSSNREDRGAVKYAMRRLDPERFDEIRAYAKPRGATLNTVFVAAFFRSMCQYLDPGMQTPQHVFVPVDLRRFLASGRTEAICNFITLMRISLPSVLEESLEATLRRVREASKLSPEKIDRALFATMLIGVLVRLFPGRVASRIEAVHRLTVENGWTSAFFSNLGALQPERMDFGLSIAEAYHIGFPTAPPGLFVSVASFRKTLTFMVSYCSRAMTTQAVEGFLDHFIQELSAAKAAPKAESATA